MIKKINIEDLTGKEFGYIMGLFVGDGYSNYCKKDRHYRVDFYLDSVRDFDIQDYLLKLLSKLDLNPYKVKCRGATRISINSKKFKEELEGAEVDLEDRLQEGDFLLGFLSGFIDADGYVAYGDIVITQRDNDLLVVLSKLCESEFQVKTRLWQRKTRFRTLFYAWNFRVAMSFRHLAHNSCKIQRIYGGA